MVRMGNTRGINHVRDTLPVNEARGRRDSRSVRGATHGVYRVYTEVHIFTRIPPVVADDGGKVIRDGLADRLPPHSRRA